MARPMSYESAEALETACNLYFNRISYQDPDGLLHWKRPPTVAGLCLALGISRRTWARYAQDDRFADVCGAVQLTLEAYLEEELLDPGRKSTRGIEFNLSNNYGWSSRTTKEVELGEQTRTAVTQAAEAAGLSLSDKIALIQEAAQEIQSDDGYQDDN